MVCTEINDPKYQQRPSPSFHAKDCKGKTKKGKNGHSYISKVDTNGIYKWVPTTPQSKTRKIKGKKKYEIHDNGSVPFIVYDTKSSVDIYVQTYNDKEDTYGQPKFFKTYKYKTIFIGYDPKGFGYKGPNSKGNSILLELPSGKFLFVGQTIKEFSLEKGDEPVDYYSPIGNNDFPYPYLIGKTHVYFLIEQTVVPIESIDTNKDGYGQLYRFIETPEVLTKKLLRMKTIHKRGIH